MTNRTDRSNRVMSALSAAEHLVSTSPEAPDSVEIHEHTAFPSGVIGVDLHFYRSVKALTAFALSTGSLVVEKPDEFGGGKFTDHVVSGDLAGVLFHAWTRIPLPLDETVQMPVVVLPLTKAPMAVSA